MDDTAASPSANAKRCFVVMGFGIKTDYATGRKLDLDKSYRLLIKPVVEQKGLVCIRADEIRQSGSIDVPMYKELLKADVVIADLSTANVNAFYELGIRHALRPNTTIVISENKLVYPFDLNHISITSYTHLGEGIEYEEVERFRKVLGETLQSVLDKNETDSPVYTYLNMLKPPWLQEEIEKAVKADNENEARTTEENKPGDAGGNKTLSLLIQQGEEALKHKEYLQAKTLFDTALLIGNKDLSNLVMNNDSYLLHRLALTTYKARLPDEISSLNAAMEILGKLDLVNTNDPETVALAGKVEKGLYENGQGDAHLERAVWYYERGFFLLHNRYHSINLAFLLNCRADSSLDQTKEEKIADMIWASRVRKLALAMCEADWNNLMERRKTLPDSTSGLANSNLAADQQKADNEQKFWILVNKAEAWFGLGNMDEYKKALHAANDFEVEPGKKKPFETQVNKIREIMHKYGDLLNPAWVES